MRGRFSRSNCLSSGVWLSPAHRGASAVLSSTMNAHARLDAVIAGDSAGSVRAVTIAMLGVTGIVGEQ